MNQAEIEDTIHDAIVEHLRAALRATDRKPDPDRLARELAMLAAAGLAAKRIVARGRP